MSGAAVEVGLVENNKAGVLFANVLALDPGDVCIIVNEMNVWIYNVVLVFIVSPMAVAVVAQADFIVLVVEKSNSWCMCKVKHSETNTRSAVRAGEVTNCPTCP